MQVVGELMSRDIEYVAPGDSLISAFWKMKDAHLRHLPVVDRDDLVGLVSMSDVLVYIQVDGAGFKVENRSVRSIMSRELVTCSPNCTAANVAATLIACRISCLPVIECQNLVGIITSTDLLDSICVEAENKGLDVRPLNFMVRNIPGWSDFNTVKEFDRAAR